MKLSGFSWLLVATVAAVLLAGFLYWVDARDTAPRNVAHGPLVPALDVNAVSAVELAEGDERLRLVRRDAEWSIANADDAPADGGAVRRLLLAVQGLDKKEAKTSNPASYDRLGLGEDATSISIERGEDEPLVIHLGKDAPGDGRRYARLGGGPETWSVEGEAEIVLDVADWAALELPRIPRADIARIEIVHPDGDVLIVGRDEGEADEFAILNLEEDEEPAYPRVTDGLAGAFANLPYEDLRKADKLDWSAPVRITLETAEGESHVMSLAEEDGWWLRLDGAEEIQVWAFLLPDYKADDLTKRKADMLKETDDGE